MKNKVFITLLMCLLAFSTQAQTPESVVQEYVKLLNEWLASPYDMQKKENVIAILKSSSKKGTMKDEIVEKYNTAGSRETDVNGYLTIFSDITIKNQRIIVEIQNIKQVESINKKIKSVTVVLKYTGGINIETVSDFWISANKIEYIVTNDKERYKMLNNITDNVEGNGNNAPNDLLNRNNTKDNTYETLIKDQNYMDGLGAYYSQDYQTAFKKWMICANQNNVTAQRLIGYCYFKGLGVEQSIKNAKVWYKKAADAGDIYAEEYCRILLEYND
ncbi:MAG: tetratricopeptide repeat protein [Bacteroidales bacterium]|nr:tetratricopeptide repeat protein [Bacteroidales bacterium]